MLSSGSCGLVDDGPTVFSFKHVIVSSWATLFPKFWYATSYFLHIDFHTFHAERAPNGTIAFLPLLAFEMIIPVGIVGYFV